MPTEDPRPLLEALASEHGLAILRFLQGRGWTLASHVAEGLGIHTTTASKHLAAFHAAGIVERRTHAAKRPTVAYRLRSPVVRVEFTLGEPLRRDDAVDAAEAFLGSLLEAIRKVGGPHLSDDLLRPIAPGTDWRATVRRRIEASGDPRAALDGLVADARRRCVALMGATTGERLIRRALEAGLEDRRDLLLEATA